MIFSYKARRLLRRIFRWLLWLLLMAAILLVCWMVWLQRFLVYTPGGVVLDFHLSAPETAGVIPQRPNRLDISIEYNDDPAQPTSPSGLKQLTGYYIDEEALQGDFSVLRQQLQALPAGTPVLLDVKNCWGYFYYTSSLGEPAPQYPIPEMDVLFADLANSGLYTIARLPALRDHAFAMGNADASLSNLWTDSDRCGWLDPTSAATVSHLVQIAQELQALGFDEVVFQDFYVPSAASIVFDADRDEALAAAAQSIVDACGTDSFTVSFLGNTPTLRIPDSHSRLYLANVAAADVADILEQVQVVSKQVNLVFLAETNDTRYQVSGVLRPLRSAQ